ncbi:MAG: hypothetical protein O7E52_21985, partial [Candidatus Poribacteria bacterium]|nr:hypothetical protein [Candidatus Poribacteria bacterium]
ASPRFEDGVRLTAWASGSSESGNYEFAISSAIYFFEIPRQAQYIEILVRYRGEPHQPNIEDYEEIAGRLWIRNTKREYSRRSYDDESDEETRYGDTFVLRAKRRSETIKIAAAGHVDNDFLEMHIVAEDGEQLDIEYIDVATYRRQPDIRVIHRYARDYRWRPWNNYTYLYFYDGPSYYSTDLGYYIRWSYPIYDHHYLSIRYAYRNYLHNYHLHYPSHHYYYRYRSYPKHVNVHVRVNDSVKTRQRLSRWTATHDTVRREYTRSRLAATPTKIARTTTQTRVRTLIEKHRQEPVLADRVIQSSAVSRQRKAIRAETGLNTTIKTQRHFSRSVRDASAPSNRTTEETRKRRRYSSDREYTTQQNTESRTRIYNRSQPSTQRRRYSSAPEDTRSNAERRARLYNRSKSSTSRSTMAPSRSRTSSVKERATTRSRSTKSSTRSSTTSRSRTSTPRKTSTSTTSRDDDDDKEKSQQRSRNTERTKRSRRK